LWVGTVLWGIILAIVNVDERGRMTVPKELGIRETRTIVIAAGSFFVVIPLPKVPHENAKEWLPTKKGRKDLKLLAEKAAKEDVVKRAKRRKQL
jgi:bifunctional DNA-binding transcriptional regulator/antitoxin component of YhaV-PrlF toxin-antitoxin module